MKGRIDVLDHSGHSVIEYDTDVETTLPHGPLSQEDAEKEFKRLVDEGHLAFTGEGKDKQMFTKAEGRDFNAEEHEVVTMVPPFVGG